MEINPHPIALLLDYIGRQRTLPPRILSVDIETRENPELRDILPPLEGDQPAAVMLDRLEIVCIQMMDVSGRTVILEGDEATVLKQFFTILEPNVCLVTWNGQGLDLPAIELRARVAFASCPANTRAEVPAYFRCQSRWGDRNMPTLDLGQACSCGGRMLKLHHAAKLFSLPGKPGDYGAEVADMLSGTKKEREVAIQYCISDVLTPLQIGFLGGFFADFTNSKQRVDTSSLFLLPDNMGTVIDRPCTLSGWHADLAEVFPKLAGARAAIASGNKRMLNTQSEYLTELLKSMVEVGTIDLLFSDGFADILTQRVERIGEVAATPEAHPQPALITPHATQQCSFLD
jgi:DNA polymerase elongation subunit (family B)